MWTQKNCLYINTEIGGALINVPNSLYQITNVPIALFQ